jgi:hypothetical protein
LARSGSVRRGTANVTKEMVMREAARIYADYPAILQALGL